ncbi:hypothetical protein [Agriterribacter sp.]|uniref:hypothetical protein n=1 Tax=Agriterribacter sp. TaxID=2821509 RepID=UPI002CF58B52|nr:hypothetical protein [Agriterribacter sp.]HRO48118.1 hypothetical protein [Agriterribacter sp.]HRQ19118.1 hypothetical protein [Agriterribacter sp.]
MRTIEVNGDEIKKGWVLFNPDLTASAGPRGVSFAANLTSDPTGIGNWSEAQFRKALREEKFKGLDNTRPLLPPMPWPNFGQLTDADIKAVFTFYSLRTLYKMLCRRRSNGLL